jgi:hypothetical protein
MKGDRRRIRRIGGPADQVWRMVNHSTSWRAGTPALRKYLGYSRHSLPFVSFEDIVKEVSHGTEDGTLGNSGRG